MFNFVWDNNYSTYRKYVTKTVMNIVKIFILTSLLLFKILYCCLKKIILSNFMKHKNFATMREAGTAICLYQGKMTNVSFPGINNLFIKYMYIKLD